jgi:uncharacterized protein YjbJ (UPF0337 family)
MNKDQIKGKAENVKGRVEQAVGALTGDKQREAKGLVDRVEGAAREKVAQVRHDTARKIDSSDKG